MSLEDHIEFEDLPAVYRDPESRAETFAREWTEELYNIPCLHDRHQAFKQIVAHYNPGVYWAHWLDSSFNHLIQSYEDNRANWAPDAAVAFAYKDTIQAMVDGSLARMHYATKQ